MFAKKTSAAFAAFLVAGLMVVGTACGGSSSKSSDSSSGSSAESPSTTMAKSSGEDSNGCAELFSQTEKLTASMDSLTTGATGDMSANMNAVVKALESFTSDVPSAIRDDWKTIVSGVKEYATALDGVDFTNLADPTTMEKLTKAGAVLDDPKYQNASNNLEAWTQKNCPGYDF
jgi:hypothetical protein